MANEFSSDLRLGVPFSPDAAEQVKLAEKISIARFSAKRLDLRGKPTFTFAPAAGVGTDCAFSIERTEGGYTLGVHTTDADEFVCQGSPLDIEAAARFCTFDTADGSRYPMIPDKLHEEVCALRAERDRLAVSVFLNIDESGSCKDIYIDRSVVRVTHECVYREVDALYTSSDRSEVLALRDKYASARNDFDMFYELGAAIYTNRSATGSRSLYTFKTICRRDEDGKIEYLGRVPDTDIGALIAELRLFAGICVGRYLHAKGIPCIYVCRKALNKPQLQYLYGLAGLPFDSGKSDKDLQAKLESASQDIVNSEFIAAELYSSLEPVYYSLAPEYNSFYGVYGAVAFARPASRYTDLMMNRLLKKCIDADFNNANLNIPQMQRMFADEVKRCNDRHSLVSARKNAAIADLQREILHSGHVFEAKYIGGGRIVLPWGLIAPCRISGAEPSVCDSIMVSAEDADAPTFVSRET